MNRFNRHFPSLSRFTTSLFSVVFFLAVPSVVLSGQFSGKPNIVFILADDLGYGDLGCYGQKMIRTPYLDKMAAAGMRFRQYYAGSTVCAPSRCALLTGLHTGHSYVRGNLEFQPNGQLPLPPGTTTVAGILGQAGYATGIIGKWGLGGPDTSGIPNRQGFDFFYGYLDQIRAHNYFPPFLWRNQEKEQLNNEAVYADQGYAKGVGSSSSKREEYSHDLFTKEALAFLTRNREKPFFLFLAYTIPHANNEAWVLRRNAMEVPDYGIYCSKPWPEEEKGYAAMISRMDQDVGKLLAKLNELGLTERTLVMFSSDNGPHDENGQDPSFFQSAGPLRGRKTDLYEGGIRVPLITYWPGKVKPGSVSDHVSAFWDFLPTCAELAGVPIPKGIDGISIVPTLLGKPKKQQKHDFLYWEFHEGGSKQAVRMSDWKAIRLIPGRPLQLYNLKIDLGEQRDVAAKHPHVIAKIESYLRAARSDSQYWTLSMEGQAPAQ